MLGYLIPSTEIQIQLYSEPSRKPSVLLVSRLFPAESLQHNPGPVLNASSKDWPKGEDTQRTSAEGGAREKITLWRKP